MKRISSALLASSCLLIFIGCMSASLIWPQDPNRVYAEYYVPPQQLVYSGLAEATIKNLQPSMLIEGRPVDEITIDQYAMKMKLKWTETVVETTESSGKVYYGLFDFFGSDVTNTAKSERQVEKDGMAIISFYEMASMYLQPPHLLIRMKNGNWISARLGTDYDLRKFADATYSLLRARGRDLQPGFGFNCSEITPDQKKDIALDGGIVINRVYPKSPAAKASLQERDVIQKINGKPVMDAVSFNEFISGIRKGVPYNFEIIRWARSGKTVDKQPVKIRVIPY